MGAAESIIISIWSDVYITVAILFFGAMGIIGIHVLNEWRSQRKGDKYGNTDRSKKIHRKNSADSTGKSRWKE